MLLRLGFVTLLVVLACNNRQAKANEDAPPPTEEELATFYERLYKLRNPLSPDEALQMLQHLHKAYGGAPPPGYRRKPLGIDKLLDYAQVTEEKCQDQNKVLEMRKDFDLSKHEYPALLPFVRKNFVDQFELCGFHLKYKEDWDTFKGKRSNLWNKMNGFKNRFSKFSKPSKNLKGNKLDDRVGLNEAFYDSYEEKKQDPSNVGYNYKADAAFQAYQEMRQVIEGANHWKQEVRPGMHLATNHPDYKKDKELDDGLRHSNLYDQVGRANFAPGMDRMFGDAYYDPDNRGWDAYRAFSELYL